MDTAPTTVLVHGAWHGSWAWDQLRPHLARSTDRIAVVDLPSSGPDGATRGDLAADVDAVTHALDAIDGSAVLVGHSYGGIPITQAAAGRGEQVRHLVYVCAFLLDTGESLLATVGGEPAPWWTPVEGGAAWLPDRPREIFYGDVPEDLAAAAEGRLQPQSAASFRDALTAAAWHDIPSTYVICDADAAIPPPAQEAMSGRARHVHHLPSSHSPYLSRPAELAALIAGVSR